MDEARQALHLAVKEAHDAGLCVIPPREDGSKAPEGYWKSFMSERASIEILRDAYRTPRCGIGLVCGAVSGHLECLDFDTKEIYGAFKARCADAGLDELVERMEAGYSESTPNGFHLLYRPERCGGCQKLARTEDFDTLIEVKAEGGYIIIAPTFGPVNPSGSYVRLSGSPATIASISMEDRDALYRVARTFDTTPKHDDIPFFEPPDGEANGDGDRPGDDFIRRGTWDFLAANGWTKLGEGRDPQGRRQEFWRRPGKEHGNSAILHPDSGLFYVFSSSTAFPVVPAAYNKFRTLVYVAFDGDFKEATRHVKSLGFKARTKEIPPPPFVAETYSPVLRANMLGTIVLPEIETLPILGRDGFFIKGGSNLLYGIPKSGKTDLTTAMVKEWIGQGRRVCYFTEEPLMYWKNRLEGLGESWEFWEPLLFCEAMGWGITKVLAAFTDDDVTIVDTIRSTTGYRENKMDEDVGRVVEPLIMAARQHNGTLIAGYHARKMPGDDGLDISGHHSLFGAFDRAVQLRKVPGEENERKRKLTVFGRLLDPEQPSSLMYEMVATCQFRALDGQEVASVADRVRKCAQCTGDFKAVRKDARFCSELCRKRAWRTDPSVSANGDAE